MNFSKQNYWHCCHRRLKGYAGSPIIGRLQVIGYLTIIAKPALGLRVTYVIFTLTKTNSNEKFVGLPLVWTRNRRPILKLVNGF